MRKQTNESGSTMIEIIMILGILGALGVSIVTLVNSMYDRYRVSRICGQIEELKKVVNNRYVADGNYAAVSAATLTSEAIAPRDLVDGSKLYHAYNGEIKVSGAATVYTISFDKVPYGACVELGIMSWTINDTSDLVLLNINGKLFKWPWVAGTDNSLPAKIGDVSTACKSGSNNKLSWDFQ